MRIKKVRLLSQIGLVALGSALGGLCRWGIATATPRLLGTAFPWGTFIINLSGCAFLGWFMTVLTEKLVPSVGWWIRPDDLRLMLAVGFTGAFTTFSTFEYETDELLRDGEGLLAATYLFASVFLGLLAVHLGIWFAHGR
jgi:CrcB protein